MKKFIILLAVSLFVSLTNAANYRTKEYRELQNKICSGWNTWYNNSMTSFVHLPEGFSINLCLASKYNDRFLKEVFKTSDFNKNVEHVYPGLRADDGSYTSIRRRRTYSRHSGQANRPFRGCGAGRTVWQ